MNLSCTASLCSPQLPANTSPWSTCMIVNRPCIETLGVDMSSVQPSHWHAPQGCLRSPSTLAHRASRRGGLLLFDCNRGLKPTLRRRGTPMATSRHCMGQLHGRFVLLLNHPDARTVRKDPGLFTRSLCYQAPAGYRSSIPLYPCEIMGRIRRDSY